MKLLTTSNIDLYSIFYEDQPLQLKLLKKKGGKQKYESKITSTVELVRFIPACQFIIDKILQSQRLYKTDWYINISSKHLDKCLGANKRYIAMQILEGLGIIIINHKYNHYKGKSFTKSYKIEDKYRGEISVIDVKDDNFSEKQLMLNNQNNYANPQIPNTGEISIFKSDKYFIKVHEGEIDISDIKNLAYTADKGEICSKNIQNKLIDNSDENTPNLSHPYQLKNLNSIIFNTQSALGYLDKYPSAGKGHIKLQIDKLSPAENLFYSVGKKSHRVFTIVNNLKREFRSFLTDNEGQRLWELDFTSSILLHFVKLLQAKLSEGRITSSLLFESEFNLFKLKVINQDFYSTTAGELNSLPKRKLYYLRDKAKKLTMYWLTGSYKNWNSIKHFHNTYPLITEFINSTNAGTKNNLIATLFRSESHLTNEKILKRLGEEEPNSRSYNLFDGFMIEQRFVELATKIAIEESRAYFGFNCVNKIVVKEPNNLNTTYAPASIIEAKTAVVNESVKASMQDENGEISPTRTDTFYILEDIGEVSNASDWTKPQTETKNMLGEVQAITCEALFPKTGGDEHDIKEVSHLEQDEFAKYRKMLANGMSRKQILNIGLAP